MYKHYTKNCYIHKYIENVKESDLPGVISKSIYTVMPGFKSFGSHANLNSCPDLAKRRK